MTSTSYPRDAEDWRGRFIVNLAAALGRAPGLVLSLWAPPGALLPGVKSVAVAQEEAWLQRMSEQGGIAHLLRRDKLHAVGVAAGLLRRLYRVYRREPVDVVHVNWLQNALPLWGTSTPAVVTVLGTDFGLLRLPGMTSLLRSVFRQRSTILAPNAEWMVPELRHRFGDVATVVPVPFGIDNAWFQIQRQSPADGRQHWVAVTRLTKGKLGDLFDWGANYFNEQRVLHLFGPQQEAVSIPAWVQYHGPARPADLLTQWFPKATGLVTLSRHDEGRPQVMLEAMAAGLPIVASDIAAHRDLLQDQETGLLAGSAQQFAHAMTQLEDPRANEVMGQAARAWVRQEMGSWDDCARRFSTLYDRVMRGKP